MPMMKKTLSHPVKQKKNVLKYSTARVMKSLANFLIVWSVIWGADWGQASLGCVLWDFRDKFIILSLFKGRPRKTAIRTMWNFILYSWSNLLWI